MFLQKSRYTSGNLVLIFKEPLVIFLKNRPVLGKKHGQHTSTCIAVIRSVMHPRTYKQSHESLTVKGQALDRTPPPLGFSCYNIFENCVLQNEVSYVNKICFLAELMYTELQKIHTLFYFHSFVTTHLQLPRPPPS